MFKYLLYHDLVPFTIRSCTSNSVVEKYSRHSYQLCQARVCKWLLTCTLICEIRLTKANVPTFHSILSMYYHTINMHKILFFWSFLYKWIVKVMSFVIWFWPKVICRTKESNYAHISVIIFTWSPIYHGQSLPYIYIYLCVYMSTCMTGFAPYRNHIMQSLMF